MAQRNVLASVFRGACARCPNCGRGRLFRAYLKPVDTCAECNVSLKHIRADDGPAWLTILVVGHIVGFLALELEMTSPQPVGISIAMFLALAAVMIAWFLPRAKGMFVGAIWAMDATGVDKTARIDRRYTRVE